MLLGTQLKTEPLHRARLPESALSANVLAFGKAPLCFSVCSALFFGLDPVFSIASQLCFSKKVSFLSHLSHLSEKNRRSQALEEDYHTSPHKSSEFGETWIRHVVCDACLQ
jgi:hypothetical protein